MSLSFPRWLLNLLRSKWAPSNSFQFCFQNCCCSRVSLVWAVLLRGIQFDIMTSTFTHSFISSFIKKCFDVPLSETAGIMPAVKRLMERSSSVITDRPCMVCLASLSLDAQLTCSSQGLVHVVSMCWPTGLSKWMKIFSFGATHYKSHYLFLVTEHLKHG